MRKAVSKRIKITKRGKILHRSPGQNHFNAKKSGRTQRKKRKEVEFSHQMSKMVRAYL